MPFTIHVRRKLRAKIVQSNSERFVARGVPKRLKRADLIFAVGGQNKLGRRPCDTRWCPGELTRTNVVPNLDVLIDERRVSKHDPALAEAQRVHVAGGHASKGSHRVQHDSKHRRERFDSSVERRSHAGRYGIVCNVSGQGNGRQGIDAWKRDSGKPHRKHMPGEDNREGEPIPGHGEPWANKSYSGASRK